MFLSCHKTGVVVVFNRHVLFCSARRTFETSLLLDETISDELPYSGELYHNILD